MSKKNTAEKLKKKLHFTPFISDLKDLLYKSAEKYEKRIAFKLKDKDGNIYGVTYKKFKEDVVSLGISLMKLGLKDEKIAVMGKNSYKWAVSYMASSIVGVVVPIDKELHYSDVINFLNAAESKCILSDDKYIKTLIEQKESINNKNMLFINFDLETDSANAMSYSKNLESGNELRKQGDTSFDEIKIDPEEMRILLFTSGTTGNAKGVCLSHKNISSNVMSTYGAVKVKRSDQVLSILPLHHTYECTLGYLLVIYSGGCIAYCDGLKYVNKNIEEYRPTLLLCVPLLLEKMYKKIEDTVSKSLPKKFIHPEDLIGKLPGIIKLVVKRKVKNTLGGRMRAFIVGAAPLNPAIVTSFGKLGIKAL
ncbi:MAG: AMP-binding protein, partial [Lachnospiraceae bacterium]|nr:AMP-binding protein [Lachnospiraceae bacterium]